VITPTLNGEGMRYWRLRPDVRLRPWIQCYWFVEPDPHAHAAASHTPDLLIPDGHSELVFRFAGGFTRWQLGEPATRAHMRESYVIGGRSKSVLAHSPGGLRMAGVKLDPRALAVLLRRPLTDLRDNTVTCADLGARALLDLEDEIANLRSIDLLPGAFDQFFLRRLTDELRERSTIPQLIEKIRATRGAQSILQWARAHRLDVRTLERRFVARMGMTPKQFARVERFKQSYYRLSQPRESGGTHIEAYYDESHFHREFRHFMGSSPKSWLEQKAGYLTVIGDHLLRGEMDSAGCGSASTDHRLPGM
jgi:AraC-like DNA-binding protein